MGANCIGQILDERSEHKTTERSEGIVSFLLNPQLIFEKNSPSTERKRG